MGAGERLEITRDGDNIHIHYEMEWTMVDYPGWLLSLGFTYAGDCNCNGGYNRKYKRGEWLIYLTKTKFKVKKHGTTVKGYSDISGLEVYLQAAIPQLFT